MPVAADPVRPPTTHAPPPKRRRQSSWLLLGASLILVAAILGGAAWWWINRPDEPAVPNQPEAPAVNRGAPGAEAPAPEPPALTEAEAWTDARGAALRLGSFEVRIKRSEFGPLLGRDATNAAITIDPQALYFVIEVRNRAAQPRTYTSWYSEESANPDAPQVELSDSAGNAYPLVLYEDVRVRYHTPTEILAPGNRVEDVLVFTRPPEVDAETVEWLHLRLGSERQGEPGSFRFEIPVDAIRGW